MIETMPISTNDLFNKLKQAFPDAIINIDDLAGDNDHYALDITCKSFKNLSLIAQHKLVNEALKSCLGTQLHALKIKTNLPKEE